MQPLSATGIGQVPPGTFVLWWRAADLIRVPKFRTTRTKSPGLSWISCAGSLIPEAPDRCPCSDPVASLGAKWELVERVCCSGERPAFFREYVSPQRLRYATVSGVSCGNRTFAVRPLAESHTKILNRIRRLWRNTQRACRKGTPKYLTRRWTCREALRRLHRMRGSACVPSHRL